MNIILLYPVPTPLKVCKSSLALNRTVWKLYRMKILINHGGRRPILLQNFASVSIHSIAVLEYYGCRTAIPLCTLLPERTSLNLPSCCLTRMPTPPPFQKCVSCYVYFLLRQQNVSVCLTMLSCKPNCCRVISHLA